MRYADVVLVRLADPTGRGDLFDEPALERVLSAAYDVDRIGAEGPMSARFDEVRLAMPADRLAALDGGWNAVGGDRRTEARFSVAGLAPAGARADAFWRGAIAVRTRTAAAPITGATATFQPGEETQGTVTLTFAEPVNGGTAVREMPLAAALLIRAADEFALGELLGISADVRERLAGEGVVLAREFEPRPRYGITVVWIVPETLFDDADWPGAPPGATPAVARDARRDRAATWLASEGIGLVTTAEDQ